MAKLLGPVIWPKCVLRVPSGAVTTTQDRPAPGTAYRRATQSEVPASPALTRQVPQLNAAIYLRISEDKSGDEDGVVRQEEDCVEHAHKRGWKIFKIYRENDVSAAGHKERPQWEQLIRDVGIGHIQVIIGWTFDRTLRTRRERLALIELGKKHGLIVSLARGAEMDLSTSSGCTMADLFGALAQSEIDLKGERQSRANLQLAQRGKMGGAPRAFGFTKNGLKHDPVEAPLVRQLYDRFLAKESLRGLAAWLNSLDTKTTRGNVWRPEAVKTVLVNPRNAGLRAMRSVKNAQTGSREFFHDEPLAYALWEPIVPEETWRTAIEWLKDPARPGYGYYSAKPERSGEGGNRIKYVLVNIARCGECGRGMISGRHHGGERSYRCSSNLHFNRQADPIEAYVLASLFHRLRQPDAEGLFKRDEATVDLDALYREAKAKRELLKQIAADYGKGYMEPVQFRIATEEARTRLIELDREILRASHIDPVAPLVTAEDPAEVWETYPLSTQRAVLMQLMRITVYRGRRGVRFKPDSVKVGWVNEL